MLDVGLEPGTPSLQVRCSTELAGPTILPIITMVSPSLSSLYMNFLQINLRQPLAPMVVAQLEPMHLLPELQHFDYPSHLLI